MIIGKAKVSTKGWVVIPKEIRDAMGIAPGGEVSFMYLPPLTARGDSMKGGMLSVSVVLDDPRSLRGKYKDFPGDRPWTEEMLEERRREREREDRKQERSAAGKPARRRRSA